METEKTFEVMYTGTLAGIRVGSVLLPRDEVVEISEDIATRMAALGRPDIEGLEDLALAEASLDDETDAGSGDDEEE